MTAHSPASCGRDTRDGVVLAASVPADEVSDWYAAADLHVFPSLGDVWGLTVNEAMACGAPNLCSIRAGCCDDLIQHGVNGLRFDPADPQDATRGLADAMTRSDLQAMAAVARTTIAPFTLDRLAGGFRQAVESVGVISSTQQATAGTRRPLVERTSVASMSATKTISAINATTNAPIAP